MVYWNSPVCCRTHAGTGPDVILRETTTVIEPVLRCRITQDADVYVAVVRVRALMQAIGFGAVDQTRLEIVVLELARNIRTHAGHGELRFRQVAAESQVGLQIEAVDQGPGIADIDLALRDGYSTAQTMGVGLPGVRRMVDTCSIESMPGRGTCVRVVKWLNTQQRKVPFRG